jgi:hypothetical protein
LFSSLRRCTDTEPLLGVNLIALDKIWPSTCRNLRVCGRARASAVQGQSNETQSSSSKYSAPEWVALAPGMRHLIPQCEADALLVWFDHTNASGTGGQRSGRRGGWWGVGGVPAASWNRRTAFWVSTATEKGMFSSCSLLDSTRSKSRMSLTSDSRCSAQAARESRQLGNES